jgi:hypothetical protein
MKTATIMIEEYSKDGKTLFCVSHENKFDIHLNLETLEVSIHANENFNLEQLSEFDNDTFKINFKKEFLKTIWNDADDCAVGRSITVSI